MTSHNIVLTGILIDSGQQLRQDDPLALKDIIEVVQSKVSDTKDALRYKYNVF